MSEMKKICRWGKAIIGMGEGNYIEGRRPFHELSMLCCPLGSSSAFTLLIHCCVCFLRHHGVVIRALTCPLESHTIIKMLTGSMHIPEALLRIISPSPCYNSIHDNIVTRSRPYLLFFYHCPNNESPINDGHVMSIVQALLPMLLRRLQRVIANTPSEASLVTSHGYHLLQKVSFARGLYSAHKAIQT